MRLLVARRHAVALLVLCAVLWSTGGLLIKWIAWPALAVAGMRSGLAAVVLLLARREQRGPWSWWHVSGALAGAASMLGFVVATSVYLLGMMAWFNRGKWLVNILTAVLFSALIYFMFVKLDVSLPKGILPF